MTEAEQIQLKSYLRNANQQFIGSYLKASRVNAEAAQKYLLDVIEHVVFFWISTCDLPDGPMDDQSVEVRIMKIVMALSRHSKKECDIGQLWYRTMDELVSLFDEHLAPCSKRFMQELSYTQAIVVIQLLRFSQAPDRLSLLTF